MIVKNFSVILLCSLIAYASSALSTNPTISGNTLKKVFDGVKPYSDLSNAFYSIKGLQLLGETLPAQSHAELCNFFKSKVDKTNLESIYYGISLASLLTNCALPTSEYQAAINAGASSQNVAELYYFTHIGQALKAPIDSKKISKSVTDGLKADSSILNQAYSLHIAALLTDEEAKKFFESIDDILEQADEVDKKLLQYEGGVGTTSIVLEGIFALADKFKKFPAKLTNERLTKFVNYLTSKRYPTNIKSAYFLQRTAQKLSDNKFKVPLVLNRLSSVSLSTANPNLVVGLTNLLGKAVKPQLNLEAESVKSQKANGAVLLATKKKFNPKSSDGTTFELKLLESQAEPDFYVARINVLAPASDNRFFLLEQQVEVKVTAEVNLADIQIGVADRDQSAPKLQKVEGSSQVKLDADQQSKFYLKFSIKDKVKNVAREAQQTFVRFTQVKTGRDIVFLAQLSNNQYVAEVDFVQNAKNFRHSSGAYTVELIVGDSLIENQIKLKLADVKIQFSEDQSSALQDKTKLYSPLPEIKHLFREPEKTPPAIVSTVFTALCAAPLALLFILWIAIGFNFSKFSFSLSAIGFHSSLAAIFGLFFCYWLKLNMFVTLKYLLIIGGVMLFTGNSLLRGLASKEKKN